MSIKQVNPYILLNGTAAQAIALYESALGLKTGAVTHYGDVPGACGVEENKHLILHAELRIGEAVLMMSDTTPERPVPTAGNVEIALDYTDVAEMTGAFDAMAVGGKVKMPLHDSFWGAKFGMLTDAYGVGWMFNCQQKKAEG